MAKRKWERMAAKSGYIPPGVPLPPKPPTGKEEAERREARTELHVWLVQAAIVRLLSWGFLGVAIYGAWSHGIGGFLAGVSLAGLARWFRPVPSASLDKHTGR